MPRCCSHRRPSWSRVILLDSEEMGVRAACRPITNSIRLLIPALLFCVEYLDLEQPARNLGSTSRCSLGGLILILVRLSTSPGIPAIPHLSHLHTRTVLHSHIEKASQATATMTSGSIGTYLSTPALLGNIQRRGLATLLAPTFSYGVNLSCFL